MPKILLVDASPLMFKVFSGPVAGFSTTSGESTGLRFGFLRSLRAMVKQIKPEKTAVVYAAHGAKHLAEFIEWKALAGQDTTPKAPLFVGKRGPLTAPGLQQLWKQAVKRAGLPRALSIHCARHTPAVVLLRKTGNLRQVQKQLGHASPATTANLYTDVSFDDMQAGLNGPYDPEQKGTGSR